MLPSGSPGVVGSSIPVSSSPLFNPSISQSRSFHAIVGETVWLATSRAQGSFGSVISPASSPSVTPSPSVSGFCGSVVLPFGSFGVDGSSIPVVSSLLVRPSISQSILFHSLVTIVKS